MPTEAFENLGTVARSSSGDALRSDGWPIEIAFLAAHGVRPALLDRATRQAALLGLSADRVLIGENLVDETRFYASLARTLQLPFSVAAFKTRTGIFNKQAGVAGMAALAGGGFVAAPGGRALELLLTQGASGSAPDAHLTITTPSHLAAAIFVEAAEDVVREASFGLQDKGRHLSAARTSRGWVSGLLHLLTLPVLIDSLLETGGAALAFSAGWSAVLLGSLVMRLFICAASCHPPPLPQRRLPPRDLPLYTVLVPLSREARILPQLIAALDALDYPPAKLQILLVIEADDSETFAALGAQALAPRYEIVVAPPGYPRTKPRALNVALARARGTLLTVYDAEDVPEPGQLRLAAEHFAAAPDTLACLQARLAIQNKDASWLTRLFALEYAALFDVMNLGQTVCGIPLPLGGTSNHFRVSTLRAVGGWDAWNVTEDADLGFRLARFGFDVGNLASTTFEEAPPTLRAWFAQRRRWCKGWLQTELTLARAPRRFLRDMGPFRSLSTLGVLVALVLSPLVWPFSIVALTHDLVVFDGPTPAGPLEMMHATLWTGVIAAGCSLTGWSAALAMRRRNLRRLWPTLLLLPVYNLLISAAAWTAIYDLLVAPYHWNKTEHGLTPMPSRPPR